jgi:hypothetical protein
MYLFVDIKYTLAGTSFEKPDQLLETVDAVFQSIEEATLERMF